MSSSAVIPGRPRVYYRCFRCQVSPLDRDRDAIWGTSDEALASNFCLSCRVSIKNSGGEAMWSRVNKDAGVHIGEAPRGYRPDTPLARTTWESTHKRKVKLVYVPKIQGVPDDLLGKWMLPPGLSEMIFTQAGTAATIYLTDGERIWYYWGFPSWHSLEKTMDVDKFMERNDVTMVGEPPAVGALVSPAHTLNQGAIECADPGCQMVLSRESKEAGYIHCYYHRSGGRSLYDD